MGDINLLPEDLRKKEEKILKDRGVFYDNVEYTEAQKLERYENNLSNKKINNSYVEKSENNPVKEKVYSQPAIEKKIIVSERVDDKEKIQKNPKEKVSFTSFLNKINLALKSKKEKSKKLGINLIPENSRKISKKVVFFTFFYPLVIVFIVIISLYFGLKAYNTKIQKDIQDLDKQITETINNAGDYNKLILEIEDWQNKTRRIKELLTKHIYWTEFFTKLENNTLENVKFSNFSGNIQGNLTFSASAPDYETVVREWMHLKRATDFVKNVIISGATLSTSKENPNGVSFSVTLDLIDNIFYKTE